MTSFIQLDSVKWRILLAVVKEFVCVLVHIYRLCTSIACAHLSLVHIYRPTLSSICEFSENRRRESRTFLTDVNDITCTPV